MVTVRVQSNEFYVALKINIGYGTELSPNQSYLRVSCCSWIIYAIFVARADLIDRRPDLLHGNLDIPQKANISC